MCTYRAAEATAALGTVFPELLDDDSAVLYGSVLKSLLRACPYTVANTSVNVTDQAPTC